MQRNTKPESQNKPTEPADVGEMREHLGRLNGRADENHANILELKGDLRALSQKFTDDLREQSVCFQADLRDLSQAHDARFVRLETSVDAKFTEAGKLMREQQDKLAGIYKTSVGILSSFVVGILLAAAKLFMDYLANR